MMQEVPLAASTIQIFGRTRQLNMPFMRELSSMAVRIDSSLSTPAALSDLFIGLAQATINLWHGFPETDQNNSFEAGKSQECCFDCHLAAGSSYGFGAALLLSASLLGNTLSDQQSKELATCLRCIAGTDDGGSLSDFVARPIHSITTARNALNRFSQYVLKREGNEEKFVFDPALQEKSLGGNDRAIHCFRYLETRAAFLMSLLDETVMLCEKYGAMFK